MLFCVGSFLTGSTIDRIELRKADLQADAQKGITVYYDREIVGEFVAET